MTTQMGMPPQLRARFDREFDQAYLRAMAYALRRSRTLPWVGSRQTVVSVARDLLNSAVSLTLAHDARRWEPERVPLDAFLCGIIRSLASNARERFDIERSESIEAAVDVRADASVRRPIERDAFYLSHEACVRIERDAHELAAEDPQLEAFIRAVASGHHDVDDIARMTGLSSREIYALKGRLQKRRARRLA